MPKTRDFAEYLKAKLANAPALAAMVEEETLNADIAQQVYDVRTEAGLTQKQLADLIDTQQSVISRVEDADYDGHSLSLLKRIAVALGKKLTIQFSDPAAGQLSEEKPAALATDGEVTFNYLGASNYPAQSYFIASIAESASPAYIDFGG